MNYSNFSRKFLPSKEILVVCILFYILGIVFAFVNPYLAQVNFPGRMLLSSIEPNIEIPAFITLDYVTNQSIYYLGTVSFSIFLNNSLSMILCVFSGVAIAPVILIGLFMKMGVLTFFAVEKLGTTGILVIFGSLHLYFEFLAALLAIEGFFNFYISFYKTLKIKNTEVFKNNLLNNFLPLLWRIILLVALAAVLEVFWSTWWVYILTHPYISWYDFYFGAYSILLK